MIEARQDGTADPLFVIFQEERIYVSVRLVVLADAVVFRVYSGDEPLCTVETVMTRGGKGQNAWVGPDWPATKARAEHIAEALRHYQQSQEGVKAP